MILPVDSRISLKDDFPLPMNACLPFLARICSVLYLPAAGVVKACKKSLTELDVLTGVQANSV